MKLELQIAVVTLAALSLAGCDEAVFDNGAAQGVIESAKLPLSGEQALISPDQILCGQKKGLWIIDQRDGGGALGRLTDAGRALAFGDDIRMGDGKYTQPYVQLGGSFAVKVQKFVQLSDETPNAKIAEAKLGVIVKHECLEKPLPLLGIDRGDFSEDANPRVRLTHRNGWIADQVLH